MAWTQLPFFFMSLGKISVFPFTAHQEKEKFSFYKSLKLINCFVNMLLAMTCF